MNSFKDVIVWRPVTAITGSAYLTSAVFDPTLCQIISLQQGKRFRCEIVGTDKYDGEHYCIIDKTVYEPTRPPKGCALSREACSQTVLYVATLPVAWNGSPDTPGEIKFL
jgi:hypothetical protein